MRDIHPDCITALGESVVRVAFLCKIDLPPPYELAFTSLLDSYNFNGTEFLALGNLGSISGLDEAGDNSPMMYAVTLSGIPDELLEAATQLNYLNHEATTWMLLLDEDHQVIGTPILWFKGLTDGAQVNYGSISSVTIQVRDRRADWQRARIERYTDQDQQRKHPGDRFFEFVSEVASKEVEWPAESWFRKNS